jgi:phosphoglycerate dehydrogenase-like enzyme
MTRPAVALAMLPVLNAEAWGDAQKARLAAVCDVLDPEPLVRLDDARADALLPRAEVLLTGWGCPPLDAAVLMRAPRLAAVVHAAGTVKNHVTEACFARGLRVTSAAAANALPVAEFTLAALLFAGKRVMRLRDRYRATRSLRLWPREEPGLGNYRKTVGIVGASMIGRRVLELLRPFDFVRLLTDPFVDAASAASLGAEKCALDDLLRRSEIVSLHAPALPETRHMIGARELALLRDGATLVNTARGSLVDMAALEGELVSGRIEAFLDVTEPEVLPTGSPLYELPNVFLTPHIAGSLGPETQRMADLALDELERFARGEPFRYGIAASDLARIA